MKKFILMLIFILGVLSLSGAIENTFQKYGSYYDVSSSTSIAVTISSSTVTTFAGVLDGVERIFIIPVESSNVLYFQRGGSTTTITSNGLILNNNTYYVDDTYFGNIYFKSTGGDIPIRATILKKQS